MRKSRKSKTLHTCKLVQTDISSAFSKWHQIIKLNVNKKPKQLVTSPLVIPIDDSDSESTNKNRNQESTASTEEKSRIVFFQGNRVDESSKTQKMDSSIERKRKIPVPFSDDDDELNIDLKTDGLRKRTELKTPQRHTQMMVNKPKLSSHPLASSTPTKTKQSLNSTRTDITNLSRILTKDIGNTSTINTSSSSEGTIIYQDSPKKANIVIHGNEILQSQYNSQSKVCNSTTMPLSGRCDSELNCNDSKKRTAEYEKIAKKQKVTQAGDKKDRVEGKKLVKDKKNGGDILQSGKSIKDFNNCHHIKVAEGSTSNNLKLNDTNHPSRPTFDKNIKGVSKDERINKIESKFSKNKIITIQNKSSINAVKSKSDTKALGSGPNTGKGQLDNSAKINNKCSNTSSDLQITQRASIRPKINCPNQSLEKIKSSPKLVEISVNTRKGESDNSAKIKNKCSNSNTSSDLQTTQRASIRPKINCPNQSLEKVKSSPKLEVSVNTEKRKFSNSPNKNNLYDDNAPSCLISPRNSSIKSKIEGKKINTEPLKLLLNLFKTVYTTPYIKNLIVSDKVEIKKFLQLDLNCQFVCYKLLMRRKKWYNIHHFCNLIGLYIEDFDVCAIYQIFEENRIVDTNYLEVDVINLLDLLSPQDLKNICATFKTKPASAKKGDLINSLLKCCKTQSTLTNIKSTEDLIKEQIKLKLGRCIKLNPDFESAFYRTYLLGTFTNPAFTNIEDYMRQMLQLKVQFPEYAVQDYIIFSTKEEFFRYTRARQCRDELERLNGNKLEWFKISETLFTELKALKDIENYIDNRFKEMPHLVQFSARAVYVSTLTMAVKRLFSNYPEDAKIWLEYMIEHESHTTHRMGEWYYHLTWLRMRYIQPMNYEIAAELLIHVLTQYRDHLSEVQLHQLSKRGRLLKVTRKYKISQWYHDRIAELVPRPIYSDELPHEVIDAHAIRENESGRKRDYVALDEEGNKYILKVEQIALRHYLTNGYTGGLHCEGDLIMATFTLFFWDIIYMDLPGSFVSKMQNVPLDMYTKYFYLRRKHEIDARLKDIESGWIDSDLIKWVTNNYDQHSHEQGLCEPGVFIENANMLETLVECIGRKVLAKIYERLLKDLRHNRSGLPDLLVWNVHSKTSKFVEVKGENDELSIGQSLWIKYLQDIGANVVVGRVHSIGSKRKNVTKRVEDNGNCEASTSTSS